MILPRARLGVNIDHVATVRNARGGSHPDPARAAQHVARAGADGITGARLNEVDSALFAEATFEIRDIDGHMVMTGAA